MAPPTSPEKAREIRRLRYVECWTARRTAQSVGCHPNTVLKIAPGQVGKIDNEPLRNAVVEVVESGRLSWSEIAWRMGWETNGQPDTSQVQRTLGLRPTTDGRGYGPFMRRMVDAGTVARLADVAGLDLQELGY